MTSLMDNHSNIFPSHVIPLTFSVLHTKREIGQRDFRLVNKVAAHLAVL